CRPGGTVYCFEPVPHLYDRLCRHVKHNGLEGTARPQRLALSDSPGVLPMAVADPFCSNQGMGSITSRPPRDLNNRIEVEAMTLDSFAARERLERLDFIKIDIQGAEPLFLKGGMDTLRKLKPDLLMEIEPKWLASLGMTGQDLLRQVSDLGYEV